MNNSNVNSTATEVVSSAVDFSNFKPDFALALTDSADSGPQCTCVWVAELGRMVPGCSSCK